MAMQPKHRPKIPISEFALHCMVADTLDRFADKTWIWTHFPAGEARSAITGARLKRMGLKPGWPDFQFINVEGRVFFLELKGDAYLSEDQQKFFRAMRQRKVECRVARSYDDAIAILGKWGVVSVSVPVVREEEQPA
jgi:hypothetical protein